MTLINDFDAWDQNTPVVDLGAGGDFDAWDQNTPMVTADSTTVTTNVGRRRAWEF